MLTRRKAHNRGVKWTTKETKKLLSYLRNETYSSKALALIFPSRTCASIRSKVRKLRIKHDLFGNSYRDTKTDFTSLIASNLPRIEVVFEAYAGTGHQTFKWIHH